MTAREYLNQATSIGRRIAALEAARASLMDDAASLASSWGGGLPVQGREENPMEKRWADYIDRAQEKMDEISQTRARLLGLKLDIITRIDIMPDGKKKDLLLWRYVSLAGWPDIAGKLTNRPEPLTLERVHQIHREAVRLFEWTNKDFFGKI